MCKRLAAGLDKPDRFAISEKVKKDCDYQNKPENTALNAILKLPAKKDEI